MYLTRNTRILALLLIVVVAVALLIAGVAALHATHHAAVHILAASTPDIIDHGH